MSEVSASALSAELGITRPTLKAIEEGRSQPDADVIKRLVELTGIPFASLMNENEPFPQQAASSSPRKQRERLRDLIDRKADGNLSEFAKTVGINKTTVSRLLSGERRILSEHLNLIETRMRARPEWIRTGREPKFHPADWAPGSGDDGPIEGEMLARFMERKGLNWVELGKALIAPGKPHGISKAAATQYQNTRRFHSLKKLAILNALKNLTDDPNLELTDIFEPPVFADTVDNAVTKGDISNSLSRLRPVTTGIFAARIIRIPVKARAGFDYDTYMKDMTYQEEEKVEVPDSWIRKPNRPQAVIEVDGDSMETTLKAGYEVLAYLLDPSDWDYVDGVVAIIYRDQFTIKRVSDNQLMTTGTLVLTSDNPVGGTRRVARNDITQIWKVYKIINGEL